MEAQKPEACKPMHVHEAGAKTEDISPKQTATEHKEEVLTGSLGQKAAQALQILAKQAAEKSAGPISEMLAGVNPLNQYGGSLLGGAAALAMPTRSLARQAEYDSSDNALRALGNVLVPGMGPYNAFKRLGAGIRSPEMKKIRALREADKLKRELSAIAPREEAPAAESAEKTDTAKAAGWKSEFAGMLNPLNLVAGYPAAAIAGLTPTRTLDEQAAADEEVLPNLFVPGRNVYNLYKRIGATTRSPEMLRLREDAKRRKMEALLAKHAPQAPSAPVEEKAAFAFGVKVAGNLTPAGYNQAGATGVGIGAGGVYGGMLGGGLGALHGLISPGDVVAVRDGQPVVKKRNRLLGALRGGAAGLAGGVLGGAALGGAGMGLAERFSPGMLAKHFPQAQERINIIRQQHAAANK